MLFRSLFFFARSCGGKLFVQLRYFILFFPQFSFTDQKLLWRKFYLCAARHKHNRWFINFSLCNFHLFHQRKSAINSHFFAICFSHLTMQSNLHKGGSTNKVCSHSTSETIPQPISTGTQQKLNATWDALRLWGFLVFFGEFSNERGKWKCDEKERKMNSLGKVVSASLPIDFHTLLTPPGWTDYED